MKFCVPFFVFLFFGFSYGQDYDKKTYITKTDTLPYRILLPENFHPQKAYPLLVFLHGVGERGKDNQKQLIHGSSLFKSKEFRAKHPAIIVFPQCPENSYWASVKKIKARKKENQFKFYKDLPKHHTMEILQDFLYDIEKTYNIDPLRRYIGGLSMGGMGTFELVTRMPNYFASAFSICGGGHSQWAEDLSTTPFWVFHGSNDQTISYRYSKKMFKSMKRYNNQTKLTIYEGVAHNSWDLTFKEPELFDWVFSFTKNK
ncbi:MAG: Uncharacterised protein [Flavobacterium sp. SCGC AAA160-P02]|nr:MAG: Uncharacterised protein [Flavobacterium sp. SCGC AAA160-P02]